MRYTSISRDSFLTFGTLKRGPRSLDRKAKGGNTVLFATESCRMDAFLTKASPPDKANRPCPTPPQRRPMRGGGVSASPPRL